MKELDEFSYRCGVIDCFSEMVKAKLKPMAMAHPCHDLDQRDSYIPFVTKICQNYGIKYYLDDDPLLSDLFPLALNKDTYNIILYQDDAIIKKYQQLKHQKQLALQQGNYEHLRNDIAYQFGKLLGYDDSTIKRYILENNDKE
ncbi:MAG: hypothetical protein MR210_07000 [Erysipelotrichaceae bacterium]|nr:hypothetical protein [Erysipelotrichaceae bacterium]MDY5252167.1 hypothetical protein [Erysipelotrichaceae bacterium]